MIAPIYTTSEVAAFEKRSTEWVSKACARGLFPGAYRAGGNGEWRIPEEAVIKHRQAYEPVFVGGLEKRSPRAKRTT